MALASKTFRIFVSSTFSDLKEERNAIQRDVFPELKKLCMQNGYRFQAVDLRWGVRDESALDQQTMNICLDEVARCQRPPRPSFIVLLGDRYGWQPLPVEIPTNEFEQIENQVSNEKDKALLSTWYKRDDNAMPAVYCLQPREVKMTANATDEEKKTALDKEHRLWNETEQTLREILRNTIKNISLTEEEKLKYISSATEQEIQAGALSIADAKEHVLSFFREIKNLSMDESAKDYIDLITDGERKQPDKDAKKKLSILKNRLEDKLGNANIFRYDAEWKGNGVTTNHIKKLCDDLYKNLSRIIKKEIGLIEDKLPLEREIDAHEAFRRDRAEVFVGREEILKKIQDYIGKAIKQPLAVYGESGTGKSALMAYSLQLTKEKFPEVKVIFRFIGATPESSDGRALLEGLCRQISQVYGADESDIPSDYKELVEEFPKRLALAKAEKPFVLYLDALDQLSDASDARNLIWLPTELPENVWLIVSTLPGECYEALEGKILKENLVELDPMPSEEGEKLLDLWLKDAKRVLQKPQREEVLGKFRENGLPLYLKLAFEESRRWKSYSKKIKLSSDIRGVIYDLFKRLSSDENHGEMIVSRSLGYLSAAKNGLTEDELIDVLSEDKEVFDDFKRRSYHEPPERRLPVVIWSRLYFDLEPYLIERSADGTSLMSFYHRQFSEATAEKYLSGEDKKKRHQLLAEYFENQQLYVKSDDKKVSNLRKLSELPFQQTYSSMWTELYSTLTNTEFLEQKNTHFTVNDLLDDYRTALRLIPQEEEANNVRSVIQAFFVALDQRSFVLKENPEFTFPQLYNRLQWETDKNILLKDKLDFEKNHFKRPWLRLNSHPSESTTLIRTFSGHSGSVSSCAFSPDGRNILSASADKTLKMWDVRTGKEIFTLKGHAGGVTSCAFSRNGKIIVSASHDKTLKIWDAESGKEINILKGHTNSVNACVFSRNGKIIVSASDDHTLKIWDVKTGKEIRTLKGHTNVVWDCCFSPDGHKIASTSWDGTLKLWNTKNGRVINAFGYQPYSYKSCAFSPDGKSIVSGMAGWVCLLHSKDFKKITRLPGHIRWVNTCVFSPDGLYIVSGGRDSTLRLWNRNTSKTINTFKGHFADVIACAFSNDGKYVLSTSDDKTLKLWDIEKAKKSSENVDHDFVVKVCTFSPDGSQIVSGSYDRTLKVWDIKSGKVINTLKGHTDNVTSCTYSPDSQFIVSGSTDKTLRIWETTMAEAKFILKGHTVEVNTCGYSPDGRRIVSGSQDSTLKVWDAETGNELTTLKGHKFHITACAFSPDGRLIVSSSGDNTLKLWDADTGKEIYSLVGHTEEVITCAFSPNGYLVVSASLDRTLKLWDVATGKEVYTIKVDAFNSKINYDVNGMRIVFCTFSPDTRHLISLSNTKDLKLWNAKTNEKVATLKGHTSVITACAFSPDGKRILSGSRDKTLTLWDIETGEEISTLKGYTDVVETCNFSPDGRFIVLGDHQGQVLLICLENVEQIIPVVNSIRIWNFPKNIGQGHWDENIKTTCPWCGTRFPVSNKLLDVIERMNLEANQSSGQSSNLHLSAKAWEDQRLLSECPHCHKPLKFNPFVVDNKEEEKVSLSLKKKPAKKNIPDLQKKLRQINSNRDSKIPIHTFTDHTDPVYACTICPDRSFKLWDTVTGEEFRNRNGVLNVVENRGLSADGKIVISTCSNGSLKLADILTNEAVFTLSHYPPSTSLPISTTHIRSCELSPDGSFIVSASYNTLKVWDMKNGKELLTFKDPKGVIEFSAISPDCSYVISASPYQVRVWHPDTGNTITVFDYETPVNDCAISPDGKMFVTANTNHSLSVWNIKDQKLVKTITGHENSVKRCLISPDGSFIVSASIDGTVRLWNFNSGKELAKISGSIDEVAGLAVSPDASFVSVANQQNTVVIWDVKKNCEWASISMKEKVKQIVFHSFLPLILCDLGSGVYIYELLGVNYEALIVTPIKRARITSIICPACRNNLLLDRSWLGNVFSCPNKDCGKLLLANPFVLKEKSLKGDIAEAVKYFISGEMYYDEKKYKEAIEAFESVIRIQDDHPMSHYYLYMIHKIIGNSEKASYHFKISTASPEIIGKTELDKLIEAHKKKQNKLETKSTDVDIPYKQGHKYYDAGKFEEAIRSYKEAIQIKPDYEWAHISLGLAYGKLGRLDEAITAYKAAIEIKPDFAGAYFFLGAAYGDKGQRDEAKEAYKNAIRFKEDDKYAHFNLGMVYKEEGSTAEAKYHFKRALELGHERAKNQLDSQPIIKSIPSPKNLQASPVRTFSGHNDPVNDCAISPDGSFVVSAAGNVMKILGAKTDYTLKVWDFETGAERFTLSGHEQPVKDCTINKDNSLIISVAEDCLFVWDAQTGKMINRFESPGFACSSCIEDSIIAVVSFHIVLLDIRSGKERVSMLTDDMLHDCAISNDGSLIITAGTDQHLVAWNAKDGKKIAVLQSQDIINSSGDIRACAISPDKTFIVSGSDDGILRIWDAESFKQKIVFTGHNDWITGCAVSPDNSRVVSSSEDGTLKIWEVATGKDLVTLKDHSGAVNGCTFSPCGKYIISAGDDKTIKVWDIYG